MKAGNSSNSAKTYISCLTLSAMLPVTNNITVSTVLSLCGLSSSVGIVNDYRTDGPGSNPGGATFSAGPDQLWGPPSLL